MNDTEYRDLQARIDADCDRGAKEYARKREKKAATKPPRRVSLKAYVEAERCGVVRKDDHGT
jgi:hypothetical protein